MRKLLLTRALCLFILIRSLGSCCSVQNLGGQLQIGISHISNESHEGAPPLPYIAVDLQTALCPFLFTSFMTGASADASCDCSSFENNNKAKSEKFRLIAGIGYSHQGGKYKEENGLEGKVVTSYINASVLFRYQTTGGFYVDAGLRPGMLLSSRDKYLDQNDDYSDNTNKFHLGLPLGIGYRFKNGVGIGVKVTPGLTSIYPTDDSEDQPNKNFVAGVTLSYAFSKKKK
jgi:hypothetical protein